MSTEPNKGKFPTADVIPTGYPTLSAILNQIALNLVEALSPTALVGGGVLLGPEALAQHDSPPRVVVVPSGDTFGGSDQNGANPRPIRQRDLGLEWHVWGFSYDYAMQLADQVMIAIDIAVPGLWQVSNGKWPKGTYVNVHGREYTFITTIELPVVQTPWPTVSDVVDSNVGIMVFPSSQTTACQGP
jgi:hypothetical protein